MKLPSQQARAGWQLPVPSPETLDFLGQWLAGREESERTHCTTALTALAADAPAGRADAAAVLAFAYCLDAIHRGRPSHAPARSVLAGADLTGANLSGAELHVSSLNGTDLRRAELTGAVLRGCDLTGARWTGSHASTTQALLCRPAGDARRKGWLVAPTATRRRAGVRLSSFTGHTGWLTAGAWSPDNTRILTTSSDGTARIWDANTGRPAGGSSSSQPANWQSFPPVRTSYSAPHRRHGGGWDGLRHVPAGWTGCRRRPGARFRLYPRRPPRRSAAMRARRRGWSHGGNTASPDFGLHS